MRRKTLKYLIYRDLFLARKQLFGYGVIALLMMVFGILVSLSTKCGNLAHVPEQYRDVLEEYLFMFSCVLPVYMCAGVGISVVESMQFDDARWHRFRLSTPVSGYIFALSKYIILLGIEAICTGIALVYMWGDSVIRGDEVSFRTIAFMLVVTFVLLMFGLLMQILILLLGTFGRALIAMVVIQIPVMCLVLTYFLLSVTIPEDVGIQFFLDLSKTCLPQVSIVFVIFLLVSFIVTATLYERREK